MRPPVSARASRCARAERDADAAADTDLLAAGVALEDDERDAAALPLGDALALVDADIDRDARAELERAPVAEAAPEMDAHEAKAEGDVNCKEAAPIDETSKGLRRALQYKEKTDDAAKKCSGCAQFEAKKYGGCGACKLFTGAVNPNGVCLSYAPLAAK